MIVYWEPLDGVITDVEIESTLSDDELARFAAAKDDDYFDGIADASLYGERVMLR